MVFWWGRDGYITRSEYLNGQSRPARAGAHGSARRNSHRSRLNSRFRAIDRDCDGKLSAGGLESMRNRRF